MTADDLTDEEILTALDAADLDPYRIPHDFTQRNILTAYRAGFEAAEIYCEAKR